MGLAYGTPLVAGNDIAALTYQQTLANLAPSGGEIDLDDVALTAHQAVFSALAKRLGRDQLALISNEEELRQAVAFEAVSQLALLGYLDLDADRLERVQVKARNLLDNFTPVYSSGDSPRVASEGVPAVGHLSPGLVFSGDAAGSELDYFNENLPSAM